jgi:hypothetical protein
MNLCFYFSCQVFVMFDNLKVIAPINNAYVILNLKFFTWSISFNYCSLFVVC